jgi:hypothetical protein
LFFQSNKAAIDVLAVNANVNDPAIAESGHSLFSGQYLPVGTRLTIVTRN